jgi:UDP-2,4-diacetamido-2,4,6-trideoxy-beta-L-altropyranose hydrolase
VHLTIRADGGPGIGYGHLVRSGALADELLSRGHAVTYATTTPGHVLEVCPTGIEVVGLPSRDDPVPFEEWLETETPDAVFTDAYPVDTDYQRKIRDRVSLIVLQDDARHAICADVFVNGNVYAPELDYKFVGDPPVRCLGTNYLLVRPDVCQAASSTPTLRETPERVLLSMGGSDIRDSTPDVVRTLSGLSPTVEIVVGPGFENVPDIESAVESTEGEFDMVHDPPDLPRRMWKADLAVTATGTTTYELLALGTPVIGVPQVPNQVPIAEALNSRGAIVAVDPENTSELASCVEELLDDDERRRELQTRGRELVDCHGSERVLETILGEI